MDILQTLHNENPYEGFDATKHPYDLQGWTDALTIFEPLINSLEPNLIIEVGSWKGQSAIRMAKHLESKGSPGKVLCVDTWLGGLEHWKKKGSVKKPWFEYLKLQNGYPSIYYQFLSNVVHSGMQDRIIPLPQTSLIAARLLKHYNIKSKMIFIDASHDTHDVVQDLTHYFPLLERGGVIFGDDYTWPSVEMAVKHFCKSNSLEFVVEGVVWKIVRR